VGDGKGRKLDAFETARVQREAHFISFAFLSVHNQASSGLVEITATLTD
jgi:hypothetical protein